jgi:hypothetical protein
MWAWVCGYDMYIRQGGGHGCCFGYGFFVGGVLVVMNTREREFDREREFERERNGTWFSIRAKRKSHTHTHTQKKEGKTKPSNLSPIYIPTLTGFLSLLLSSSSFHDPPLTNLSYLSYKHTYIYIYTYISLLVPTTTHVTHNYSYLLRTK